MDQDEYRRVPMNNLPSAMIPPARGTYAMLAPTSPKRDPCGMNQIARPNNLEAHWMPFTANRAFKAAPRMLAGAEGMHYYTPENREILDGTAGLWCVNAGHGRREITEAIQRQAATLDFAPTFQMGHPIAFQAAARLAEILPAGLDRVFWTNSGSESADTALKIALAYQRARGQAQRTRLIGRERGYHGVGFGGMSVGGIGPNRAQFGALLPHVDHLPHTHSLERNAFSQGQPAWGAHLADALDGLVALHGDTIAAVMVEPVAGSTGVLPPPLGYLERLRALCTKHDILLIFDEVITGFGRMGTNFGAERFAATPDLMTLAKGLTNAAVPMGAVAAKTGIYDAILNASPSGIELFHGYTYSGHPLACAAAIATMELHRAEDLPRRARAIEPYWQEAVHSLRGTPGVIDIRNCGLIAGIELEPGARPTERAMEVFQRCFDAGVLIRTTGDSVALSPPLIIERSDVDRIVDTVRDAVCAR
jgi:beta-alanine--pyruvate transaminase